MALKLYNTLTRKKEVFKPIKDNLAKVYTCGPTVYWHQHIGNLRSYINWDILKRVLLWNNFKVKHVMNVTDVGHLTSDEDDGEDKVEKAAKKEHKTAKEITRFYFNEFKDDFDRLNILSPDVWAWATEHIKEQIELIKELEKKGYTYQTSDGIYFDTSKFKDYGKLSNKKAEDLQGGKRVKLGEKKNKTDFALWKFTPENEKRQQEWSSPWGVGFPGWHIECSAMSSKYLGKQFDIHTGGEDHIPVHHENEIAQSEAVYGKKPWVRYWLHGAWLIIDKGKMSKSKGDIITISRLQEKGFSALAYRYFCFSAHYRKQMKFSEDALKQAQDAYDRLKNIISGLKSNDNEKENKEYIKEFEKKINDDLDMPGALSVLWKLVRDKSAKGKIKTIEKIDSVLGLDLLKQEEIEIPEEIKKLAEEREEARKKKDFEKADKIREKLRKKGWEIRDEDKGYFLDKGRGS